MKILLFCFNKKLFNLVKDWKKKLDRLISTKLSISDRLLKRKINDWYIKKNY